MSYDLWLWRRAPGCATTDAKIYAMLIADVEVTELAPLDAARIGRRLDAAFPGWRSDEQPEKLPFLCSLNDTTLVVETFGSTPERVFDWLGRFAEEEGLTLFDPQVEHVPAADVAEAKRMAESARFADANARASAEFGGLRVRAETGDAEAQCELGNRFSLGEGTDQDSKKAAYWYEQAARNGSSDGMFNLAACFQRGEGVALDVAAAIRWYEKAAENDRTYAPFALGEIYLSGEGIPRDNERAREWFSIALENGHPDAKAALRMIDLPEITPAMKRKAWKFWSQ